MTPTGSEQVGAPEGAPGAGLRQASWWGTGVFTATAAVAASAPDLGALAAVAFAVAVGLFLVGCVAFFAAYLKGIARSRADQVAVTTLYFLVGDVPSAVRRSLLGSLAVEVAVALGTAIARPYTSLAAGALVPMYGLGLCGLWAARHASFPPREPGPRPPGSGARSPHPPDATPGTANGS